MGCLHYDDMLAPISSVKHSTRRRLSRSFRCWMQESLAFLMDQHDLRQARLLAARFGVRIEVFVQA